MVVDATGREDGDAVTLEQMQQGIAVAGHELRAGDIVLVHTGTDRFYGQPRLHVPRAGRDRRGDRLADRAGRVDDGHRRLGLGPAAADPGRGRQAANEQGILWAAHQVDRPYSQIERLTNLAALPQTGFHVACFPLKIEGASAAPARVVGDRRLTARGRELTCGGRSSTIQRGTHVPHREHA